MSVGLNSSVNVSFMANKKHDYPKSNIGTISGLAAGVGYGGYQLYKGYKKGSFKKIIEETINNYKLKGITSSEKAVKFVTGLGQGVIVAKYALIGLGIGLVTDFIIKSIRKSQANK